MEQNKFIHAVNEKYKQTKSDKLLIPVMNQIADYYSSIGSRLNDDNDVTMKVGFDRTQADSIYVELDNNVIQISRSDESIDLSFVSKKDNEFTSQYQHLNLNTLKIDTNDKVINSDGSLFTMDILDNYLKYLLA